MGKYPLSKWGNPLTSFPNMSQSKEHRRLKFKAIRALGYSVARARRYRDWRESSLARILGIQIVKEKND